MARARGVALEVMYRMANPGGVALIIPHMARAMVGGAEGGREGRQMKDRSERRQEEEGRQPSKPLQFTYYRKPSREPHSCRRNTLSCFTLWYL